MCDDWCDSKSEAFRTQAAHTKFKFKILPKKITQEMDETKTPSKIKNSEETENDEDDDALKHVNLFSKYQNRSLKFGDGTFLSDRKTSMRRKRTHTMKWKIHNHTHTKEMKHIRTITHILRE